MNYKNAKKLHNNDEVILKKNGEIVTVINTEYDEKNVYIYVMTNDTGYTKLHHKEIK